MTENICTLYKLHIALMTHGAKKNSLWFIGSFWLVSSKRNYIVKEMRSKTDNAWTSLINAKSQESAVHVQYIVMWNVSKVL